MTSGGNAIGFWSGQDVDTLSAFLMRDGLPDHTMDASMIDGFLAAILSGPRLIMPSEAFRWVWDSEAGEEEVEFASQAEAEHVYGLLMKQWNAIADALTCHPERYEPLILERTFEDGRTVSIIDEWCTGYHTGMALDREGWRPLLAEHPQWLQAPLLYGSTAGWSILEKDPLTGEEHQALADGLADMARRVHAYWLQRRVAEKGAGIRTEPMRRPATYVREQPKLGRNDPCHCGSGKKYKHCHGVH